MFKSIVCGPVVLVLVCRLCSPNEQHISQLTAHETRQTRGAMGDDNLHLVVSTIHADVRGYKVTSDNLICLLLNTGDLETSPCAIHRLLVRHPANSFGVFLTSKYELVISKDHN